MSRATVADRAVSPIKYGAECPDVPAEMRDLRENLEKPANSEKTRDIGKRSGPLLQWRGRRIGRADSGMRREF